MWSGADKSIAEEMSGNIVIKTAEKTNVHFIGNQSVTQAVKYSSPPNTPPKDMIHRKKVDISRV